MSKFADLLPEVLLEEFWAFVKESCLVTRTSLQSALDIADTLARVMAFAITKSRASSCVLRKIQKLLR